MKIYLASASPRRREIVEKIGIEATVRISGADEDCEEQSPAGMVEKLSALKALSVADDIDREGQETGEYCVIGADTVVSIDSRILGKPADEEDAARMLRMLSGRKHQVYTGVTVVVNMPGKPPRINTFHEKTDVEFCAMSDEEIRAYIATGDPMDKAGAYGVQSYAAPFVCAVYGDYYNVMGLPASRVYHELKDMGCI